MFFGRSKCNPNFKIISRIVSYGPHGNVIWIGLQNSFPAFQKETVENRNTIALVLTWRPYVFFWCVAGYVISGLQIRSEKGGGLQSILHFTNMSRSTPRVYNNNLSSSRKDSSSFGNNKGGLHWKSGTNEKSLVALLIMSKNKRFEERFLLEIERN